jgi:hypothetical protein
MIAKKFFALLLLIAAISGCASPRLSLSENDPGVIVKKVTVKKFEVSYFPTTIGTTMMVAGGPMVSAFGALLSLGHDMSAPRYTVTIDFVDEMGQEGRWSLKFDRNPAPVNPPKPGDTLLLMEKGALKGWRPLPEQR